MQSKISYKNKLKLTIYIKTIMGLSFSFITPILPVYINRELGDLVVTIIEDAANSNFTYKIDIYMNSILKDSFLYPANPTTFIADIDLSPIMSTYFESEVYQTSGSTLIEPIIDSVVPYYLHVESYDEDNNFVSSGNSITNYIFNGCANIEENFSIVNYLLRSKALKGNFLTNWLTDRSLTLNDKGYLSILSGNYGPGYATTFNGIKYTRHQYDGSTSAITVNYISTTKAILNIDVSPSAINNNTPNFINDETEYYVVEESGGYSNPINVNVFNEFKHSKFYNFMYTNRLGGSDFFTAVKTSNNQYSNKKKILDQYTTQKIYYTEVQRTTSVLTQFLSVDTGEGLNELFSSPAVKLWFNDIWNDVRITSKRVIVRDRYPKSDLIQYDIEFEYNNKYFTQQY